MTIPAKSGLVIAAIAVALLAPLPTGSPAQAKAVLVQARAEILAPARLQVEGGPGQSMAVIASPVRHHSRLRETSCGVHPAGSPANCAENLFEFE